LDWRKKIYILVEKPLTKLSFVRSTGRWEIVETGSQLCPMVEFRISAAELPYAGTTELVNDSVIIMFKRDITI
jgi:hypothetical protein